MNDEPRKLSRRDLLLGLEALILPSLVSACFKVEVDTNSSTQPVMLYGNSEKPLNDDDLDSLKMIFVDQMIQGERKLDPNTTYTTIFCRSSLYNKFPNYTDGESYEHFIARQFEVINEKSKKIGLNIVLREVVIVNDDIMTTRSLDSSYLDDNIPGSDGIYHDNPDYNPNLSSYSYVDNNGKIVDMGWIHEAVWHATLRGNDSYALEYNNGHDQRFHPIPSDFKSLQDTENPWTHYLMLRDRQDITNKCISVIGYPPFDDIGFGEHAELMLKRRLENGTLHDFKDSTLDLAGWRADLPNHASLAFTDSEGNSLGDTNIKIYRTERTGDPTKVLELYSQSLNPTPIYCGSNKLIKLNQMFNITNGVVPMCEGTLLIDINGQYFRWMDIRDFQIPKWKGKENPTLNLKVISQSNSKNIPPESFDHRIIYD
ncbi:MAG: hypothetical protein WA152_01945 [Microgenomates group bacterium]